MADKTNKRIARVLYRLEMRWEQTPDKNLRDILADLGNPTDRRLLEILEDEE